MLKFPLRNLILVSSFFFFIAGCSPNAYRDLMLVEKRDLQEKELVSFFDTANKAYLFKTKINLYRHYFTGLLLIKKGEGATHRVVFMNETGFQFFDLEMQPEHETIVHACIEQFDRKAVLKTIEKDIQLLLMNDNDLSQASILKDKNTSNKIYKLGAGEEYDHYYFMDTGGQLLKIENAKGDVRKVEVLFSQYVNSFPHRIAIVHHDIKLDIKLELIER